MRYCQCQIPCASPEIAEKRRRDSLCRRKSRPKLFQITELTARIRVRTALSTVTPAAAAAAATATGTAVFTRPGLIYRQAAPADLFPACAFDRGGAFGRAAHRYKRESAGLARRMIRHQSYIRRRAVLVKKILKIIFGGIKRKVTYVQFHLI